MATRAPRSGRTGRGVDRSRQRTPIRTPLGALPADRRGGALVEYLLLGLVAIVGLLAWPRLDTSTSKKLKVQAECGLLNADCGGGPSAGSAQATPVAVTPGLQGKLDQLTAPKRRARLVPRLRDDAIMNALVSLQSSIKEANTKANQHPLDLAEMLARMQRGAPSP